MTGGTGFIGRSLTQRLSSMGHQVVAYDSGFRSEVGPVAANEPAVEIVRGDIRDEAALDRIVGGAALVVHLAAVQGTGNFYRIPLDVLDVNIRGTFNVMRACAKASVPRVFFSSSSEIYGIPSRFPTPETEPAVVPDVLNARYSYGGSKILGELIAINAARQAGFAYTIVRFHNVYGPRMGWDHVIPQFIERLETGAEFTVQGDGEQTRSFCYLSDAIEGSVLAMLSDTGRDQIFNIGNPTEEHSINDLIRVLASVSGKDIAPRYAPFEGEGTRRRVPDITRARELLGFRPVVPLTEGLATTYRWYADALSAGARPAKVWGA